MPNGRSVFSCIVPTQSPVGRPTARPLYARRDLELVDGLPKAELLAGGRATGRGSSNGTGFADGVKAYGGKGLLIALVGSVG